MPSSPGSIGNAAQLAELLITALDHGTLSIVHKPWGHELIIETGAFLLKVIEVDDGKRTSLQHHEVKDEVQWVLGAEKIGGVHVQEDDGWHHYGLGDHVRVRPGTIHRTVGPCLLVEVTTLHNDDVIRHEDDYGRASS